MKTKQILLLLVCAFLLSIFVIGCDSSDDASSSSDDQISDTDDGGSTEEDTDDDADDADDTDDTDDSDSDDTEVTYIILNGTSIALNGSGATVNGSVVTITSAGTYNISGTLSDGQIAVNTEDEGDVKLVLDGVDISNSSSAAINVMNAEETVVVLQDGTVNSLSDGSTYVFENADEDEPNAALFSKDDLTIEGNGSLSVDGNYNDGIATKDDLEILGGAITITAVDDGIRGKAYIVIENGDISVDANGDGLKSDNDEDTDKGYITIESGTIDIIAGGDAIQAETNITIEDGDIDIVSGGGSNGSISDDDSAKGIKAGTSITINGGTISIDSADDTINSNDSIAITGGTLNLVSGDDAVHGDAKVQIDGGQISISQCYEGLESSVIIINDGDIYINASDDGVNAVDGTNNSLTINGGFLANYTVGDGLDVNGSITMTDGVVIIHGPTTNGNGALDYDRTFNISGGLLVAAGSSGMSMAPSTSSFQYSVLVNFDTSLSANTLINLQTSDGNEIVTFKPAKAFQSIAISSPKLTTGSYSLYTGGGSTGTNTDGLYENGTYSPGSRYTTFSISSIVTTIGNGGFGPGPQPF